MQKKGACPAAVFPAAGKTAAGQAMLLSVFALGGAILGATTIAGLLMLYQIRATGDSVHSAQAIFAADSGTEWALYDYYCNLDGTCSGAQSLPGTNGLLSNGATTSIQCFDGSGAGTSCESTSTAAYAIAKGNSLTSRRAFYLNLSTATTTLP